MTEIGFDTPPDQKAFQIWSTWLRIGPVNILDAFGFLISADVSRGGRAGQCTLCRGSAPQFPPYGWRETRLSQRVGGLHPSIDPKLKPFPVFRVSGRHHRRTQGRVAEGRLRSPALTLIDTAHPASNRLSVSLRRQCIDQATVAKCVRIVRNCSTRSIEKRTRSAWARSRMPFKAAWRP